MDKKALTQAVKHSISEVMEAMFFLPVYLSDRGEEEEPSTKPESPIVAAKLDFKGPFSGSFYLFVPQGLAISMSASFLGTNEADISQEQANGTVKETVNMIAGRTFAHFDDQSVFDLGIPQKLPLDQIELAPGREEEIPISILTLDNQLAFKMVIRG